MRDSTPLMLLTCVLTLLLAAGGRAQDRALTTGTRIHSTPKISPDGKWVAYLADGGLYVQPIGGGTERQLLAKAGSSYFWDSNSASLLIVVGNSLNRVARSGGSTRVADLTNKSVIDLYGISPDGSWLYGMRQVGVFTVLFRIQTGSGLVQDLITFVGLTSLDIDASGKLLISASPGFGVWTFYTADADGKNLTDILGQKQLTTSGGKGRWLSSGKLLFEHVDYIDTKYVTNYPSGFQLWSLDIAAKTKTYLTSLPNWHRGSADLSKDKSFASLAMVDAGSGIGRAVLVPVDGGGEQVLSPPLWKMESEVRFSPQGDKVAYVGATSPTGSPQVRIYDLDALPMRVSPVVRPSQTSTIRLPLATGEVGIVLLGFKTHSLTIPGFQGHLELDPTLPIVPILSGVGPTLTGALPIPDDGSLVGQLFFLQALRIKNGAGSLDHALWLFIAP